MSLPADVQSLEPDNPVVMFIFDGTLAGADTYYFHPYGNGVILFQGVEYEPWNIKADGFELSGNSSPSPKLQMENVSGFIGALCEAYNDLTGCKITRKRTLAKYLDNGPDGGPGEEFPPEIWYIEQKTAENKEYVEFELSSALDFQGVQLPRRQIIQNYCPWRYRGSECGYLGPPVADEFDIITTDASKDRCGKRMQSCFLRFGEDNEIPFGGFPAAGLTR